MTSKGSSPESSLEGLPRCVFDALPDPAVVTDGGDRLLLANRRAVELLVGASHENQDSRSAAEANMVFFRAFLAQGPGGERTGARPSDLVLTDPKDGSDLLFEVSVIPLPPLEGAPQGTLLVLRDRTELKLAAAELRIQAGRSDAAEHQAWNESRRLNVIIENAGVPIFVTDRQTNVTLMNREAEHLLEAGPGGGQASPRVHDIRANDAKLAGFVNEFLLESRLRSERRFTLVDPEEAREFPAVAVSTKILDEHYQPVAVVTVLRDLTQEVENQHLAEELRRLNAELEGRVAAATRELAERNAQLEAQSSELERASRMKSEFLATMSHELRTPINAVLGYNSLLREGLFGQLTEKQEDALDRMRNAAEHLLAIINDILDLSRVEAGKIQLSPSEVDLGSFLAELSASVRPMAERKSLGFAVELEGEVPRVRTDEKRLRQVLLNLLSNAVKFTDDGSITLRAAWVPGSGTVCLEVIDTGIGIDEEKLETIFEAFTQVDQSATRQHGGAGLGLAISRRFIRVMGGELTVSSQVGKGTTFRVELPLDHSAS